MITMKRFPIENVAKKTLLTPRNVAKHLLLIVKKFNEKIGS